VGDSTIRDNVKLFLLICNYKDFKYTLAQWAWLAKRLSKPSKALMRDLTAWRLQNTTLVVERAEEALAQYPHASGLDEVRQIRLELLALISEYNHILALLTSPPRAPKST
jgi:hypothetical protein